MCCVIPVDTQLSAVDSLIDSMMLVEEDDNAEQKDIFKVHHIPNPAFQRHFQVLQSSLNLRDPALLLIAYSELRRGVIFSSVTLKAKSKKAFICLTRVELHQL